MRIRLILAFAFIVILSIGSITMIARRSTENEVRAFMYRGGMADNESLIDALTGYYAENGSWQGVEDLIGKPGIRRMGGQGQGNQNQATVGGQPGNLKLADANGVIVYSTSPNGSSGELTTNELDHALPILVEEHTVGYLLPGNSARFSEIEGDLLVQRLNNAALSAGLISGGISLLLAIFLAATLLRPIRELTQATQALAAGDLSQRVQARGGGELAIMGSNFNRMATSLQQAEESRRAMTADIAHELRTPLAVQRANLEALQDGIYPLTPENLTPILEQNHLLTHLVDDLRTLALADAGQIKLEMIEVELPSLAARVAERFTHQAKPNDVHISIEGLHPCPPVTADPSRVEQILGNLISNALRYTPKEGVINLSTECTPDGITIKVHDNGPGIPPEALPHIFERFYRANKSRSRAEGGTGLGLAIARKLAEAHGGTITAENHPTGGAVFTLLLPYKPADIAQENTT